MKTKTNKPLFMKITSVQPEYGTAKLELSGGAVLELKFNMKAARKYGEYTAENPAASLFDTYPVFLTAAIYGGGKTDITFAEGEEMFEQLTIADRKTIIALGGECLNFLTETVAMATEPAQRSKYLSTLTSRN